MRINTDQLEQIYLMGFEKRCYAVGANPAGLRGALYGSGAAFAVGGTMGAYAWLKERARVRRAKREAGKEKLAQAEQIYLMGFEKRCEAVGVNPVQLMKWAQETTPTPIVPPPTQNKPRDLAGNIIAAKDWTVAQANKGWNKLKGSYAKNPYATVAGAGALGLGTLGLMNGGDGGKDRIKNMLLGLAGGAALGAGGMYLYDKYNTWNKNKAPVSSASGIVNPAEDSGEYRVENMDGTHNKVPAPLTPLPVEADTRDPSALPGMIPPRGR